MNDSLGPILALIIALGFYLFIAYCLFRIAEKTNTPDRWMAWVPIIQIFLLLKIARKPAWWFLGFLIPLVNLIVVVIVWMEIAIAVNKPNWLGVLMLIPFFNLAIIVYLAFSSMPQIPETQIPTTPPSIPSA
ncbi:MAG: hypothetical protein COU11_04795 [Candidatus Harrisonbacteria bacterium CG10_big_fil_rev_8_21_14_0_10_49_15]|uniref:Signal peptidase I n=1 Tax=Candidatus Harrisonbacteria bacterium CG10_big_fil_rev_8_21_14_0_10_49_15 TaxID=1974587 RepID=A0A2H0UJP4_9BACT|nr:MAG: hypothetical protein COU11_04795 [Candidatus Harrisonbacteria bacterium CG10_big_fil_rev_8_21_14_0_10_49_15]